MSTPSRLDRKYGWKRDNPDFRDFAYHPMATPLPMHVDLRPKFPNCYDQGNLGSCTGNAIAGVIEFDRVREKLPDFTPSRLFIYYQERVLENDVEQDNGAQLRNGVKAVNRWGAPAETEWPYDVSQFAVKPPEKAYQDAAKMRALSYQSVSQNVNAMRQCLAGGFPFVLGFQVYESFESDAVAKSGIVPMPSPSEGNVGGHAVVCVGYTDVQLGAIPGGHFIIRNSWGTGWGMHGYFAMPYGYLENPNLSDDFWKVTSVA